MKLLFGFLFIALTLNGVLTLPARNNPQDDAEVISQPRQPSSDPDFHDFKGVIDTGSGYPFLQPHPSSFNLGFFDSFEDIFRRLRSRIWPVIPSGFGGANDDGAIGTGDDSSDDSGSGFSFGLRPLIPLNPKNGNTTSTVKVVDGHKVEINETVYGDSNNVFKVRVVNVRPLASGEEVAKTVTSNQGEEAKPTVAAAGPSTSSPFKPDEYDDEDENDRREPLEKQPKENEIHDIDGPQV
ncbi:uncharacterized protein Dwil_GK14629 [Drosophila willistoni]|uniref:Icarapin-like n=1 Tax=Drosophila willistoni TaxID=7260 RepID=B4MVF8_DROWI|nr:uncharacterized protein LOC6642691 [Drosophila willistoni]EDW76503.2 uncharacterized protein Dwil_GK14629 [Drosophila willistoni]